MIYIEYIDRDRHMPNQIFRQFANQSSWTDPDDGLVGMFGRTMRIGPYPAYFAFWKCKGMERMDEWEAYFRSEAFGSHKSEQATFEAIHLVRGGCYDALIDQSPVDQQALFCIEYFGADQADEDSAIIDHFRHREDACDGARLDFVLRRIGAWAPIPAVSRSGVSPTMSVWNPSSAAISITIPIGLKKPAFTAGSAATFSRSTGP